MFTALTNCGPLGEAAVVRDHDDNEAEPPRDPNDDDDDAEDEESDAEPDDDLEPPVVREPDE